MLRCASSRVVAAYVKVGLTPRELRALPLELFMNHQKDAGNGRDCSLLPPRSTLDNKLVKIFD
jgi:hypothetical protein